MICLKNCFKDRFKPKAEQRQGEVPCDVFSRGDPLKRMQVLRSTGVGNLALRTGFNLALLCGPALKKL